VKIKYDMFALLCFCVATEFSVNKDLYNYDGQLCMKVISGGMCPKCPGGDVPHFLCVAGCFSVKRSLPFLIDSSIYRRRRLVG